ncbi:MAG: GLPGLI family protein, partial [Nonlabens sp.]
LKDYTSNKVFKKNKLSAVDIHYIEDQHNFNWKLRDSISIINGYKCNMATLDYSGRSFTVWFTSEIPIPDGPFKFKGLPGLIVKMDDSDRDYSIKLSGFEKSNFLMLLSSFQESRLKSKLKFYKSLDNYYDNPILALEADGQVFSPEVRKLFKEKYKDKFKYLGKNRVER